MKFTLVPFTKISFLFYIIGTGLLLFSWFDQWQQLNLLADIQRAQAFIVSIIIIAVAAIINLTVFIINNYFSKN